MSQVDQVLANVRALISNITSMNHEELQQLGLRVYDEARDVQFTQEELEQVQDFIAELARAASDLPVVQTWRDQIAQYYPQQVRALQSWIERWSSIG